MYIYIYIYIYKKKRISPIFQCEMNIMEITKTINALCAQAIL